MREEILSAIQDGLYSTKRMTSNQCEIVSEGILQYLNEAGFVIIPKSYLDSLMIEKQEPITKEEKEARRFFKNWNEKNPTKTN